MMKKSIKILFLALLAMICFIALGPKVTAPIIEKPLPTYQVALDSLPQWIAEKEAAFSTIKPNNASRVIFADSLPQKTPYAIVYLHGFSGSTADGAPVHEEVAKSLGANLYLPRLFAHGLTTDEPMLEYTGEAYVDSAREAIAVGQLLGEKVIVMSTSTGATAALTLAASHPEIEALILYAPNIRINHPLDFVATFPWGLQIIRWVEGGNYHTMENPSAEKKQYWTTKYRLEAPVQMQKLLETAMVPSLFNKIKVPTFVGYFYKNENEQDPVVSVSEMKKMFEALGTPSHLKEQKAFPDAGAHEIACSIVTDNYPEVREATLLFLNRILE